ncbi:MAG: hypothetical protein AAGD38_24935 [Acidobacteriota bacterium]
MIRLVSLSAIALAALAVLLAAFIPQAELAFVAGAVVMPVALCALGCRNRWLLVGLLLLLGVGFALLLGLRGEPLEGPWIFGLPAALAIQIYVLTLVPFLLTVVVHALDWRLSDEDLERIRRVKTTS